MANKKLYINSDNVNDWLGSLGFLFPKNSAQLKRFDTLYSNYPYELTGQSVDIGRIINFSMERPRAISFPEFDKVKETDFSDYEDLRMVARKGGSISHMISEKMIRNQQNLKNEE